MCRLIGNKDWGQKEREIVFGGWGSDDEDDPKHDPSDWDYVRDEYRSDEDD